MRAVNHSFSNLTFVGTALAIITLTTPAITMPICTGGDRAARQVTCIVDGDTGWERGRKWRAKGVDTPEISHADCAAEKHAGIAARDRLRELMAGGYEIEWSGARGSFGRDLVTVRLADGRDAGQVLITQGLSQPWPNDGNPWC
ncbi:thermonuclease family protein [Amorphus orientalis]|uniref:Endonuclease YncB(Thermonuclease family) n=1 Tax=Amorphus orientalis TaxID=649198 RepID=A0AAE4AUE8_9HYPH|nr:thermonuclease family protein [Amorphus orientalis]MDQ0317353.1 endonuclease YncB(thermonuclease family) [Amorphus orientalis]